MKASYLGPILFTTGVALAVANLATMDSPDRNIEPDFCKRIAKVMAEPTKDKDDAIGKGGALVARHAVCKKGGIFHPAIATTRKGLIGMGLGGGLALSFLALASQKNRRNGGMNKKEKKDTDT